MTQLAPATLHRLDHLETIFVTGAEAKTYLQGQLSFDLNRLSGERMELATCNSPQGRVQAVLWLIERTDGIVLLLPASMLETALARLKKYILRAKVKIEPGTERFQVCGAQIGAIEGESRAHRQTGDRSEVNWPSAEPRVLSLVERGLEVASDPTFVEAWRRADIAAGLPQVYPQTHEAFVAQMLNADLLGGIGFEKGCYTGQEIIARTHFRGAIKRRMFRFRAACAPPAPGTRLVVGEQHAGDVVDAVATEGGCELLAVVNLSQIDDAVALDTAERTPLARLPLPYQV
jgi:folate-binding protein YgfZ